MTLLFNKVRYVLDVVVMEIIQSQQGMQVVWFIKDEVIDPVIIKIKRALMPNTCNEHSL
jgi:hypothetical protein